MLKRTDDSDGSGAFTVECDACPWCARYEPPADRDAFDAAAAAHLAGEMLLRPLKRLRN